MTDIRERPPPATAPAAVIAATRPARIVGLDGIRGLAALFVVLNHIFERAWPGCPAHPAPFWAAWLTYGRGAVAMLIALSGFFAGSRPGVLGVAVQVDRDVRAPTGLAHLAAVLGRARMQSGDDLVRARSARQLRRTGPASSSAMAGR
jgi:hypothetical protein